MHELQIRWVTSHRGQAEPRCVVWVNVAKLDAALRIARVDADAAWHRQFIAFLERGIPVRMPIIGVYDDGSVVFEDGRHRFAWVRDHGAESLPVQAYDAEQERLVRQLFGGRIGRCQVAYTAEHMELAA
jgi:hypothetical protein